MKRVFSVKHRTLIDIVLIVCFLLTAALTGSYLAYYSFLLLPFAGALGDFRMNHKSTLPILAILMGYWVAYLMNAPDGPVFYAILYGALCGIGALFGILLDRTVFKKTANKAAKIIGLVITVGFAVLLLIATFQYVGNPISIFSSTAKANRYIDSSYPGSGYKVTYSFYDMSTGSYICTVSTGEGEELFELEVKGGEVTEKALPEA